MEGQKGVCARPRLSNNQRVYPPAEKAPIPTWVGVGGSPESVVRAAKYGLPLMLAIIGGSASRFKPYVDLYKEACEKFGHGECRSACTHRGMWRRRMRWRRRGVLEGVQGDARQDWCGAGVAADDDAAVCECGGGWGDVCGVG